MTRPIRSTRSARPSRGLRAVAALAATATLGAGLGAAAAPAQAAPAPRPASTPWMSVSLTPAVSGRTLTYRYAEAGRQHLVRDGAGRPYANRDSAGYTVFLDGKIIDGGNGTGGVGALAGVASGIQESARAAGAVVVEMHPDAGPAIARAAQLMHRVDFTATYLALGQGLDPAVSRHVTELRDRLGR